MRHGPVRSLMTLLCTLGLVGTVACKGGETGFTNSSDDATADEGTGAAEITPLEIDFEEVDWEGYIGQSAQVKITNVGDNNLKIYSFGLSDSADGYFYSEDEDNLELSPGSDREFTVGVQLDVDEQIEGELRIRTSDADNNDVRIPLTATPMGWEGGEDGGGDEGGGDSGGDDTGDDGDDTGDDGGSTTDDTGT